MNVISECNGKRNPIGVFDSGFGGLTVLREIVTRLPDYDYLYLGDNARAPYGIRSFEVVYSYTLDAVKWLFSRGCPLVVLACNTASAKALRTIQQRDLPHLAPDRRVLGVIRPVTEQVGKFSTTRHVGIFATPGTVRSDSYTIEINNFFPDITVTLEACPLWVPLVENNEIENNGANYFVQKHIDRIFTADPKIDTLILGCTHYPLLIKTIRKFLPPGVTLINQGSIVADRLTDYLQRHPEIERACTKNASKEFYTTDCPDLFDRHAQVFYGRQTHSEKVSL
jgi:glutamate racemase